jgi:hypothetical protein
MPTSWKATRPKIGVTMVDLRARNATAMPDETQDVYAMERITPPAQDLLDALKHHFAIYLPKSSHAAVVADQVAEQRGAWRVIEYLENIQSANLAKERQ